MSTSNTIATVTEALRNLLSDVTDVLPDAKVTTKPPHKARTNHDQGNQLNLFLYYMAPNASWRERSVEDARTGQLSPLALDLYYLITAYGRDNDEVLSHQLIGEAMSILHGHQELPEKSQAALPGNGLDPQVEKVRIMPQPISQEDVVRWWNTFNAPYGLSLFYQVSVVLIAGRQAGTKNRQARDTVHAVMAGT